REVMDGADVDDSVGDGGGRVEDRLSGRAGPARLAGRRAAAGGREGIQLAVVRTDVDCPAADRRRGLDRPAGGAGPRRREGAPPAAVPADHEALPAEAP